jgi:S-DNA-T family DNA segregation ATPase FtsK/SpoIIIE
MSRSTKKTEKANPIRAKYRIIFGAFLFFAGLASVLACLSFLMHWKSDLSAVNALGESAIAVENVFKSLGLFIGYLLVYKGFGISGTLVPVLFLITGFILFFNLSKRPLISLWSTGLFWMLWITFLLYLVLDKGSVYAGIVGYEIGEYIELYIGRIGLLFSLLFTGLVYAVIAFKWTPSLQISPLRFP